MSNYISNCCGAKVAYVDEKTMTALCTECKELCGIEEDEEMTLGSMDRF